MVAVCVCGGCLNVFCWIQNPQPLLLQRFEILSPHVDDSRTQFHKTCLTLIIVATLRKLQKRSSVALNSVLLRLYITYLSVIYPSLQLPDRHELDIYNNVSRILPSSWLVERGHQEILIRPPALRMHLRRQGKSTMIYHHKIR